ncbi:hypothetical protein [uncultured Aquimarina sp.]|uniref:hypothetical protein n=1 Tax=uncultured Aquimarina sp. TaxID=575652 RepID=UPI002622C9B5|nr:hypothetical protein [uncultured Aquimarina sp.]
MKQLIKLTGKIILLGLIVSLNSCGDEKLQAQIERQKKQIEQLEQTIAQLKNCVIPALDKPVDNVALSIELKDFSQYYYNFFKMRRKIQNMKTANSAPLNELQTLFSTEGVWFDYNDFKEYIAFIDKNAEEANITISGLRFFPAISEPNGKMVLVYNPTIKRGSGNFSYALQKSGGDLKPVLLKDIIPNYLGRETRQQKGSLLPFFNSVGTVNDVQSQAGNRGQLNPPPVDILDQDSE